MADLYADEVMESGELGDSPVQQQQQPQYQDIVLTDIKSTEDAVLLEDPRVLTNMIERQETAEQPRGYFETVQTEIKPHMRKIVSDWMLEVCEEQQCQADVFPLAVDYMDRFLSKVNIKKSQFQLLGATCLFLASKFKETSPLPAENLVIFTDHSITTYELTVSSTSRSTYYSLANGSTL